MQSGALEIDELQELVQRMGFSSVFDQAVAELDADRSGVVSKQEFERWYHGQLQSLVRSPLDILYATVRSDKYWWFVHDIWLKLAVNVIYTWGYHGEIEWDAPMHLLLAGSVAFIIKERPFHNLVDRRCWCYSLLSLACVTHIRGMFKVGEPWSNGYMVAMIFLFVLPVLGLITGKINMWRNHKDSHEAIRHKQKEQAKHGHWMARRATKKIATIGGGMRLLMSADEEVEDVEEAGAKSAHEASPQKLAMAPHGSESDEEIPLHEAASELHCILSRGSAGRGAGLEVYRTDRVAWPRVE